MVSSRTELTPEQHARIRRHLALIPVYLWLVYGWAQVLAEMPKSEPLRDFIHFYVQGAIARERNAPALYDMTAMSVMVPRLVPGAHEARFPPVYGPQISVFFRPFAALSYVPARTLWLLLSGVAYAICSYAVWQVCPRLHAYRWTTLTLLVAAPALHYTFAFAQISALALACVTAAFLALRANRPFLAGLAVGSLAYKPPLGIAAAAVFVGAGEWRVVFGAATAAAAQLAVGAAYWGPSILGAYVSALGRIPGIAYGMERDRDQLHSWRAFFELLQLPPRVALAAYAVAVVCMLALALAAWRTPSTGSRQSGTLATRYSVLLLATVLVDPHLYAYDLIVLVPAYMLLWDWSLDRRLATGDRRFTSRFEWLLYACYLSPLCAAAADAWHVQPSVLLTSALAVVVWRHKET